MKVYLLILFSLLLFSSCNSKVDVNKNDIIGNWYSCEKDIGYSEHHFKQDYLEYYIESFDNSFDDIVCGYKLSNDTIYFFYDSEKEYLNYYVVESISGNIITYRDKYGKSHRLDKIQEVIEEKKNAKDTDEQIVINNIFSQKILRRKEKYNCQHHYIHQGEEGILILEEDSND